MARTDEKQGRQGMGSIQPAVPRRHSALFQGKQQQPQHPHVADDTREFQGEGRIKGGSGSAKEQLSPGAIKGRRVFEIDSFPYRVAEVGAVGPSKKGKTENKGKEENRRHPSMVGMIIHGRHLFCRVVVPPAR